MDYDGAICQLITEAGSMGFPCGYFEPRSNAAVCSYYVGHHWCECRIKKNLLIDRGAERHFTMADSS